MMEKVSITCEVTNSVKIKMMVNMLQVWLDLLLSFELAFSRSTKENRYRNPQCSMGLWFNKISTLILLLFLLLLAATLRLRIAVARKQMRLNLHLNLFGGLHGLSLKLPQRAAPMARKSNHV